MTDATLTERARAVLANKRKRGRVQWRKVLVLATLPGGCNPCSPLRRRTCEAMVKRGVVTFVKGSAGTSFYFATDLGREVDRLLTEETTK